LAVGLSVGQAAPTALLIAFSNHASPSKEGGLADFVLGAEITDGPTTTSPQSQEPPPEPFFAWVAPSAALCHGQVLPDEWSGSSLPRSARCGWPDGKVPSLFSVVAEKRYPQRACGCQP